MKQSRILGSNHRNKVRKLFTLLLGVFCWVVAIINQRYLAEYHGAVSVRNGEAIFTKQAIENVVEDMTQRKDSNIPEITLWKKEKDVLCANERINTSLTLSLVTVAGDINRIYPEPMLYGNALFNEDYEGCIIDRNTAYKLFRSESVVGMKINTAGREFIIRGVVKPTEGHAMIIRANKPELAEEKVVKYSCMELVFSNAQNATTSAKKFVSVSGNGNDNSTYYIDGYLYQKLAERLIHIPIWFIALFIIGIFIIRVNSWKASPILFFGGCLMVIILGIIMTKLTDFHLYYPNSLIPNRWSDFDFWVRQWKEMMSSLKERSEMIQYGKEIMLRKRYLNVVGGVVIAVIVEGFLIKDYCFGTRKL